MEIGHNLMHGQWDWMNDPHIHSSTWEWDAVSTAKSWKYSHNFQHHQYTNVVGKDRDLGYSAMRVDREQPWHPVYLLQPVYGVLMALVFEWGIAALRHGARRRSRRPQEPRARANEEIRASSARPHGRSPRTRSCSRPCPAGRGSARWPPTSPRTSPATSGSTPSSSWATCPDGAETFSEEQLDDETRGEWYVRQMVGSCNLEGTPLFHMLTGHLELPDRAPPVPGPAVRRYPEIAPAGPRGLRAPRTGLQLGRGWAASTARSPRRSCVCRFPGG